ncbi:MAG: phosphoribosylformylglycinamidine cyclo-ligase, partial [Cyanobacteria bacterium CAN_BIN43]|nr:phosphoribosylformylglycinamidine cyclo-ligase [Cyanobacteria bacterium CAN_BIN43]
ANQSVQVDTQRWSPLPVFDWLAQQGRVTPKDMFNTFNMGIGFVLLVPPSGVDATIQWFEGQGILAWAIGEVVEGVGEVMGAFGD